MQFPFVWEVHRDGLRQNADHTLRLLLCCIKLLLSLLHRHTQCREGFMRPQMLKPKTRCTCPGALQCLSRFAWGLWKVPRESFAVCLLTNALPHPFFRPQGDGKPTTRQEMTALARCLEENTMQSGMSKHTLTHLQFLPPSFTQDDCGSFPRCRLCIFCLILLLL